MLCIHSSPLGDIGTRDTGGMSIYVRELAQALGRLGHCIDIYTRPPVEARPRVIELSSRVRVIHLPIHDSRCLGKLELYPLLPEFLFALEDFRSQNKIQYDVVYSHYWLSGLLGDWVRQLWQVPHLITFHTLGALKNSCGLGHREPELRVEAEKNMALNSFGSLQWDAKMLNGQPVPAGMYFYQLLSPTKNFTGKIVVVQ